MLIRIPSPSVWHEGEYELFTPACTGPGRSEPLEEIRSYSAAQMDTLWDEIKRFEYPHTYYVDLSQKLWETKQRLMEEMNQQ